MNGWVGGREKNDIRGPHGERGEEGSNDRSEWGTKVIIGLEKGGHRCVK